MFKLFFKKKKLLIFTILSIFLVVVGYVTVTKANINPNRQVGDIVDSFNDVKVYYNGGVSHVEGRNLTADGYNLGLKYQCVEFIKRYYYQRFQHKMPDSYGHAKSFFNSSVASGTLNSQRNLKQFSNGSVKPQVEDILVFDGTLTNRYGHVAIISRVTEDSIEIIQQNPGPFASSRETIILKKVNNGSWTIEKPNVLGFLRRP
ncbi:CHAP domain-containing protein [Entomomonas sp. E2T0]|uniref:CHAP domain-containing protein n=1 Tax=Entomomonas sp. E2T0 TaxID=2930213 RepID=UPI0022284B60|nr:CHAP domain-containing protein [Entomomonas sp. E2T0]UYZ85061.1 CHAP domain-containing protein [Entomomonas sp. E2T0]